MNNRLTNLVRLSSNIKHKELFSKLTQTQFDQLVEIISVVEIISEENKLDEESFLNTVNGLFFSKRINLEQRQILILCNHQMLPGL